MSPLSTPRIALKAATKAAEHDVTVGWATGAVISVFQLLALLQFAHRSPAPLSLFGAWVLGQFLLSATLTVGVFRRRDWAAAGLFGLFVVNILIVWVTRGRAWPPISIFTPLVGYGLFRGLRGTEALASHPSGVLPTPPNERRS
jgi:hypothetical protein